MEKGEKRAKMDLNSGHIKSERHPPYSPCHCSCYEQDFFCHFFQLNHKMVGRVSVNSPCQQSGLFTLDVNRQFLKKILSFLLVTTILRGCFMCIQLQHDLNGPKVTVSYLTKSFFFPYTHIFPLSFFLYFLRDLFPQGERGAG